ncbi:Transient receptor potential cation channel subfamily A member 1 [Orchesella cincta]|uniref:Transient receptor potential cation channel subfamily A member 1 n=1 Tax=Orchesella cincta TaxID=48709 RepID=A0A1D2N2V6_ORCCI|nr:Transient receptor potential cation channel subfamily A member 1 [Orchesella cincta]
MFVAESGNVKEFTRLITADPSKLNVRDSRGRASVHQATVRNHVTILEVIVAFQGNLNLTDNHGNNALHLAVESEALEALEYLLSK